MILSTSKASYHTHTYRNMVGSLVATDYKDPPTILRGGYRKYGNSSKKINTNRMRETPGIS